MAPIKIAFLSRLPLEDKRHWSGSMYKMYEAMLDQGFDIKWIPTASFSRTEEKVFQLMQNTFEKIFKRRFSPHHFLLKAYIASTKTQKILRNNDYDLLFSPTYINEIAFLDITKPIIYLNDGTFNKLIGYNPGFMGMGWLSKKITRILEKMALQKASHLIFSSEWAAVDARKTYGISEKKISVIRFGANLRVPQLPLPQKDYSGQLNILFSGVGWIRKGGNIAFESVKLLNSKGYNIKFKIMGCTPNVVGDYIEIIPFLSKNNPAEMAEIEHHLSEAHFMFVPTRTDCSPIAFCEAAAYSLPVISTNTGGVSTVVEHGKTGFLMSEEANAEDYAVLIEEQILKDRNKLVQLAKNARRKYEEELNWDKWGADMRSIIDEILNK